ncbi:MAG: DUF167 domain-containing protein [Deltaproteobacteria bacterium]|nr:DUF167 domain-containing protein [Deltaproteobacteria bacterium]
MSVPTSSSSSTSKAGFVQESDKGVFVLVRVQPGAAKDALVGVANGFLKIRLNAKPVDNAANKALVSFLSKTFKIKKTALTIETGLKSREKRVRVEGMDAIEMERILSGEMGG